MYRSLDPSQIIRTLDKLGDRISERFPGSGLANVARELSTVATKTSTNVARVARANIPMRIVVGIVLIAGLAALGALALAAFDLKASNELTSVVQALDSTTSLMIVFGGAAFYLSTFESRWRRDRALKALHELRSIIHVIDMHQLTKDPSAFGAPRTSSSPDRSMSAYQLLRYLGYCSELLSLASKVAALYADKIRDPVIVDAVGDIERLTAHLNQKTWQKIELVQQRIPQHNTTPPAPAKAVS